MMSTDDSDSDKAKETLPQTPELSSIYKDEGIVIALGSLGGCGVVTIKRTVHGFKKLSLVTREEISRSELSLPDMEFDTFAFWLDCSADVLSPQLGDTLYGHGVHALSHAMMAVAPLFVPCTAGDLDTDHRVVGPTKVCLFDVRAGGSGICSQLWKSIFVPGGLIEAAIEVLADCPTCSDDEDYDGGCPGCIQAGECTRFNDFLSKSSGWVIAKYLLARIKKTELYMKNLRMSEETIGEEQENVETGTKRTMIQVKEFTSPRREKRARAMRYAFDLASARERQVVVGRPSWPMDGGNNDSRRDDSTGD